MPNDDAGSIRMSRSTPDWGRRWECKIPRSITLTWALLALAACQKDAAPTPTRASTPAVHEATPNARERFVKAAGGNVDTIETKVVTGRDGKPVRVTTFQAKQPTPGQLDELSKACGAGDYVKCWELGRAHQAAAARGEAEKAWTVACDADEYRSCYDLGSMLSSPFAKLGRDLEAVPLIKKACEGGIGVACYTLGGWHTAGKNGLARDTAMARGYYEAGCDVGHYWACDKIGKKPKQP
jgi:TPR repeat protein